MASSCYDQNDPCDHACTTLIDDDELLQCMLNYLEIEIHETFLLDYGYLTAAQQRDPFHWFQSWIKIQPIIYGLQLHHNWG